MSENPWMVTLFLKILLLLFYLDSGVDGVHDCRNR